MSTESTTEAVERLQPERQALADALEDMLQYKYPDKYAMGFALLSRLAAKGVAVVAAERAAPKVDGPHLHSTVGELIECHRRTYEAAAARAAGIDADDTAIVSQSLRDDADALAALRHLFFIMERLDRQAGPPFAADHNVKITTETWIDLVRPAIHTVQRRLAAEKERP